MYAVELRFAIDDLSRAPTPAVVVEGLREAPDDLYDHVEHARVRRRLDCFHVVLFVTAASAHEAEVVCGVIGVAAATAVPALRFAGVRPWPAAGERATSPATPEKRTGRTPHRPRDPREEEAP